MLPSMSRHANPYDNATCESFLKTLKREEIHATTYRDFEDVQNRLEEFIERYYNQCRLHSALGYCLPANFGDGADSRRGPAYAAAAITFIDG
jgi:transposase InsO family protein